MLKAIFNKEFLKTKVVFFICLAIALCVSLYVDLSVNRIAVNKGVEHIWLIMLMKDNLFVDALKYIPCLVAIAISMAQMMPEISQKRLKLTLHLPCNQNNSVLAMLFFGFSALTIIYLCQIVVVLIYYSTFLPFELVTRTALTIIPWYLAGYMTYFIVASICIESTTKSRVIIGIIGLCLLYPFYVVNIPEAYNNSILLLLIFSLLGALFVYRSIYRFKEGASD